MSDQVSGSHSQVPKVISSIVVIRGGLTGDGVKFFMENPTGNFNSIIFKLTEEVIGEFPNNKDFPLTLTEAACSPNHPNLYHVSGTVPPSNLSSEEHKIFQYKAKLFVEQHCVQENVVIFMWNN